jgi:phosphoserine phosphatase
MLKENLSKHVLISVSGPDHPGITSALMDVIVAGNCAISDMGQSVTHGLLSLSFFLDFQDNDNETLVIKSLLFESKKLGLELDFKLVLDDEGLSPLFLESDEKYVLHCVSTDQIPAKFIRDVSKVLATNQINITRIDKVSPHSFSSLEMTTANPSRIDLRQVKSELMDIGQKHLVDVAYIKDNVFRRSKRLIVFDMDSTLIQTEVIDEMAEVMGVGKEIREITEKAMQGELDFQQSLIERVKQLKGLQVHQLEHILKNLKLTPGVQDFIKTVKALGYKIALISGGFGFFAHSIKEQLGLDYAFANNLEIVDDTLTGRVLGTIVDAQQKALLLELIAQQESISLEQVVAIGDGANDIPMLSKAGLGIAFHAKEIVKRKASQHMSYGPMTTILYFLGIPGPFEKAPAYS